MFFFENGKSVLETGPMRSKERLKVREKNLIVADMSVNWGRGGGVKVKPQLNRFFFIKEKKPNFLYGQGGGVRKVRMCATIRFF